MKALNSSFSRWLACALAGLLAAYLFAVLTVEPEAHDASRSAWHWFWQSYGSFCLRGLLFGGAAGLALVRFVPSPRGARGTQRA